MSTHYRPEFQRMLNCEVRIWSILFNLVEYEVFFDGRMIPVGGNILVRRGVWHKEFIYGPFSVNNNSKICVHHIHMDSFYNTQRKFRKRSRLV